MLRFIRLRRLALLLGCSFSTHALRAQTVGVVRGRLVDVKDSTPITNALIIVRPASDSLRVIRAQVLPEGFTVRGLALGAYNVRITAIGYAPVLRSVSITQQQSMVDMGVVGLTRFAVQVKGVEVTAQENAVSLAPDRSAYKAKDVAPGAANASEVLEQTPSVQVDQDGKVSLRGNESVVVQINGRPTPITGVQLGAYLKSLPANAVDRIEVIPNPSAKYDPDGAAGIINVVMKTGVDLGLSGGTTLNLNTTSRYAAAGNLGYQSGPLTTSINVAANNDVRDTPGLNDLASLDASGQPVFVSNQNVVERNGNGGQTLTTGIDYKITPRDVLSNSLTMNRRIASDETSTAYFEASAGQAGSQFNRLLRADVGGVLLDEDLALKHSFIPGKHELNSEVRFTRVRESTLTTLWQQSAGASPSRTDGERDDLVATSKQFTWQMDYTRMLAARTKLETGYKGNRRWLDRDFDVSEDPQGTGVWTPSDKTNALGFVETVNAGYGVVSQNAGKFDLQAGLRLEQADRNFTLATTGETFPFQYGTLFPSAVVRFTADEHTQMSASYSRRIRRPASNELNPFQSFYDLQNVFVGNPRLNPELSDAFELGLTRSGSLGTLQVTPFFRFTRNLIRTVIQPGDPHGSNLTTFTYANIATSRGLGTDIVASLPSGRRITGFASFNGQRVDIDGPKQPSLSPTGFTWTGRLNGTAQITRSLQANAAYIYRAEIPVPNGHFYRAQNTSITLKKTLTPRSSVGVNVIDPLGTNTFHIRLLGGAVDQETERTLGLRALFVRYQYSFGRPPRLRDVQPTSDAASGRPG